uniref:Cytochrome P450 n=1 Tax=Vespula pensylvanica TaxID=30213 RepID=A0A834N2Q0_VESPE|nr:hypothetical protein H0235_016752 [Vespula pensylvanica]
MALINGYWFLGGTIDLSCFATTTIRLYATRRFGKGKTIDVKDIAAKFTSDPIGITAYGLKANSPNDPNADFRLCGKKIFDFTWSRGFEILTMFLMPSLIKLKNVEHRINSGTKKNDLIDLLIELKTNYEGQDFAGFRGTIWRPSRSVVFFTGGFETSTTTLAFSLHELALHPEIQKRLRKEILEALQSNDDKITYELVSSLPYLNMVVSEILFSFIERITADYYKVPGHEITLEKGTPVYISNMGLHYEPRYFPEPHDYDPKRFSEGNKQNIIPYTYLTFDEGSRTVSAWPFGIEIRPCTNVKKVPSFAVREGEKIPMRLD